MSPFIQVPFLFALAILLGTQLLRQTLDFTKPSREKSWIVLLCLAWLTVLLEIFALPITSWLFPINGSDAFQFFGAFLLVILVFCFFLWWGLSTALEENGSQKFWRDWWGIQEKILLFCLPKKHHNYYHWHIRWRFLLLGRKIVRRWQRLSINSFLTKQRWLWVLLAAFAACKLVGFVLGDDPFKTFNEQLKAIPSNAGAWSLLTILAGTPIAYVLWKFRDTNTLWQIENHRKDINLKDFQKLTEWASGLHLVEDRVTAKNKFVSESITERETSTESNVEPAETTLKTITRREGSVSLQIAAIYQLQAFLRADYGKHFQQPAFALLKSIWLAIMQSHTSTWKEEFEAPLSNLLTRYHDPGKPYFAWLTALQNAATTPLAQALSHVIASGHGQYLRDHQRELSGICLAGLNSVYANEQVLELEGLNLHAINLQGAKLKNAQMQSTNLAAGALQGAHLNDAQLQNSILTGAQLHGADLTTAKLQGTKCHFTQFTGANLIGTWFQDADLSYANLEGAELMNANFQYAKLDRVYFHNARLEHALLQGADISNSKFVGATFDSGTQFTNSTTNENTLVEAIGSTVEIIAIRSHVLRCKLRQHCGLLLHESAYTEYLAAWENASEEEQRDAVENCGYVL